MKKIIATSCHPGGANSIVPVIKLLQKDQSVDLVVIGYKFSEEIFERASIPYKTIKDYGLPDSSVESMDKLIRIELPDIILTGTSIQNNRNKILIEQILTVTAKKKGVKTLSVLDVWGCYSSKFSNLFPEERFKFLPDKIAVMDEKAKKDMIKEGFNGKDLVVTGNPHFDNFAKVKSNFDEIEKNKVKSDLGINNGTPIIMYVSQPIEAQFCSSLGYTEKTVLQDLLDVLSLQKQEFALLIKVHPRQDLNDFNNLKEKYGFQIVIDKNYPTTLATIASDLVIGSFSTVLIEANYLGKTPISFQPGLKTKEISITNELSITIPVYEKKELNLLLNKFFENGCRLTKRVMPLTTDGKAIQRVVNLINEMLAENGK